MLTHNLGSRFLSKLVLANIPNQNQDQKQKQNWSKTKPKVKLKRNQTIGEPSFISNLE